MKTSIDKLYLLMLQAFRHEMGLLDDKTWSENLDILLEAERDLAKTKLNAEFGVSSAGYNNDSILKSIPDEKFWSQDDIWEYTEPEPEMLKNERYIVYRIKDLARTGTSYTFIFENASIVQEVRKKLEEHIVKKYLDGISSIFMNGSGMKISFKDYDSQTDFFSSYVFYENDEALLKFKRWPALEAD